jgi:hypothetical protein
MTETWYCLFDGESVDGRGNAKYVGRTTDEEKAKEHYDKCWNNPYSIGYVMSYTDTTEQRMFLVEW